MSEITHGILDATHVMFNTIKDWIMEILDDHLGALHVEIASGQLGVRSLAFFMLVEIQSSLGRRTPSLVASRRWIMDTESAQWTSFSPKGSKMRFVAFLLRDRARDWWEEDGHAFGVEVIEAMTWTKFVTMF